MLNFQTPQSKNSISANTFKRNSFSKPKQTKPKQKENDHQNQQSKQIFTSESQYHRPHSPSDNSFTDQMEFLIDQNTDYFQSKMRISDNARPNQYRFKIPTKTPLTIYKKHFDPKTKDPLADKVKLNRNQLSEMIKKCQSQQKFMLRSTYQTQYGIKRPGCKAKQNTIFNARKSRQIKEELDKQVPRYMETQNNHFFLNWGAYNSTTSLKPSHQSIVANLPFDGKTTYKNDFQQKPVSSTSLITHQSTLSKFKSPLMINRSCYSRDFTRNEKKLEVEKSYKPQHEQMMKTSSTFKGCTEYCSQFMKQEERDDDFSFEIDKENLKTLIMDL